MLTRLALQRGVAAIAMRLGGQRAANRLLSGVRASAGGRAIQTASAAAQDPAMFCFQCEQTQDNVGCTTLGVCGKTPDVAAAQDLLLEHVKNIGAWANATRAVGGDVDNAINRFTCEALFSTLTNVNFDKSRFDVFLEQAGEFEKLAQQAYVDACKANGVTPDMTLSKGLTQVHKDQPLVLFRQKAIGNEDVASLAEFATYALKGMAAYTDHAAQLGYEDASVYAFAHEALAKLGEIQTGAPADANAAVGEMLELALAVGAKNLEVMALLDQAHTETFGHPEPTDVSISAKAGKAILVSGHDIADLKEILEQTKGTGINVYTHGELLPANAYPALKEYPHLAGNYAGAWQNQTFDFAMFPGPVVVTTNCIQAPRRSYADRIYTTNTVGVEGVKHIPGRVAAGRDYSEVIAQAQELEGFATDEDPKSITIGFGHNTVLSIAGTVIDLVKGGNLKHMFLIGGCDGNEAERSAFTDLAKATPEDSLILTLGCGKYRFNKLDLGTLPGTGLPRVLDMGQCNDALSALKVALALQDAFGLESVNDLPLSLAVSWFEQKAAAVLATLLHLGVENIRLGPQLPAFITPNVLDVLVNDFKVKPLNPDADAEVASMLKGE